MRRYLLFILASIILASCGSAPPEIPDWCYPYDFRLSDQGFSITSGQWVDGTGLQTVDGSLSFSYNYGEFVTPSIVYVTVQRDTAVGDITVSTAGTIYGVSSAFSVGIPSGNTDIATASFLPEVEGDAGSAINVTINLSNYAVVEELNILSIEVLGNGETPFDHNPCDEITPTPSITPFPTGQATFTSTPTATSTATATATSTPTDTFTPTVTNTPSPTNWCYTFNFVSESHSTIGAFAGWYVTSGWGDGYSGGNGWQSEDNGGFQELLFMRLDFPIVVDDVTDVEWTFASTQSITDAAGFSPNTQLLNRYSGGAGTLIQFDLDAKQIDRTFTWTGNTGLSDGIQVNTNPAMTPKFYLTTFYIEGVGDAPFPSLTNECIPPTPTPVPTNTPTTTATPFGLPTNTPYNYQPTVDLTVVTGTPTITSTATSTDFPQSTPYATLPIDVGTPTPSVEEIRENEAEWEILEEQQRSNNAVENLLQDILDALQGDGGGEGDGGSGDGGTGEGTTGISGVSDWANAISDSLFGIQGLFGRVGGFFSQAVSGANALVTSFYTAPPSPIPGLPQCMTAPLEHDICAIYYIMDWTIFAPNTLGSFIIPLLLAIMNTMVIFKVLRYVLKLINRTEDVTR